MIYENTTQKDGSQTSESLYNDMLSNVVLVGREYLYVRPVLFAEDASNEWRQYTALQFRDTTALCNFSKKFADALLSRLRTDAKAMYVSPKNVLPSYPLHKAGYQFIGDTPYFVQKDWKSITPVAGSPEPVIRQLLRMFGTQTDIVLGWLQGALMRQQNYLAQLNGEEELPYPPLASQTLCLCGGQGFGKTRVLLSCIIGELLGAYTAIPASWYNGKSKFGDWLLTAPVYVADDCEPLVGYKERVAFASRLKALGYPEKFSCECKGKGAIDLTFPNERICLANIKYGAIESLPDTSIDGDKFLVLHICGHAGCVEDYEGNFMRMDKDLRMAIPAFAYWLLHEYSIPEWAIGTATRRHAVMNLGGNLGYVAPAIKKAVAEIDKAGILMSKIRRLYLGENFRGRWFTRMELRGILEAAAPLQCHAEEFKTLLTECHKRWPHIIDKKRRGPGMEYMICNVPDFDDAMLISHADAYGECWNQELLTLVGLTQQELEASFNVSNDVLQNDDYDQEDAIA